MAKTLRAVYDEDLRELLESLGIADAIEAGRLTCFNCGVVVRVANLACLFPLDGEVRVCCDASECIARLPEEVMR